MYLKNSREMKHALFFIGVEIHFKLQLKYISFILRGLIFGLKKGNAQTNTSNNTTIGAFNDVLHLTIVILEI